MKKTTIVALALLGATAPLSGQSQPNSRVIAAMSPHGRYQVPLCPLKGGDFRTSSAGVYLKTAAEGFGDAASGGTVDTKKYTDIVTKAQKVALDAVAANPQNAAGWYYLGRADLQLGDLRGADSAFIRLQKLSPDCEQEIKGMRQKAWLALVSPSADFMSKGQLDSALAVLRAAQVISQYYPQGYYNLAGTFTNMKPPMVDSAVFYFKVAQDKAAGDPQFAETLKNATFNLAYLYQAAGDNANAIVQYRKYLVLDPGNLEVKRALASTLRLTGSAAEAAQLEAGLVSSGEMSTGELAAAGVRNFNDKNYAAAADAFQKILAIDPANHDGLFNLANTYLALQDPKKLIETSEKLLDIDPLGPANLRLLFNGYRLAADTNKQIDVYTRLHALTVGISVATFTPTTDGAKWTGAATGQEGRTASDKVIPPKPMVVVFEFTNAQGAVVASQEVALPALKPDEKQDIPLAVTGAGIVAWRYHLKQ